MKKSERARKKQYKKNRKRAQEAKNKCSNIELVNNLFTKISHEIIKTAHQHATGNCFMVFRSHQSFDLDELIIDEMFSNFNLNEVKGPLSIFGEFCGYGSQSCEVEHYNLLITER